jgi:YD repeat-containing protein
MKFSTGFARATALVLVLSGLTWAGSAAVGTAAKPVPHPNCAGGGEHGLTDVLPTVTLEAPVNGAAYPVGASISVNASASDGTISGCPDPVRSINVYDGSLSIYGNKGTSASFTWTGAAVGTHILSATVTDTYTSNTYTSNVATITVNPPPPTVSLTASGTTATAPGTFTLTAAAADGGGTITQVAFYSGATLLGTVTAPPYAYAWTGIPAGSYSVTAVATNNAAASTTSAPVALQVNPHIPPTVSMTAPASGTSVVSPGPLTLTASAADTDGTISQVAFYNGTTLIGTATASPYSYTWTGIAAGSYSITAVATDNASATARSSAVAVQVAPAPPPPPPQTTVPDVLSDAVGAIAAQFRVDESGSATYAIPIYTPPGVAGVAPQVALSYSSQGGQGPLGKGWAISGLSGIVRCRQTREAGDFISGGIAVDGDPQPINFSATDQFCLDGQRLIPVAPAAATVCASLAGATVSELRTEIDSQTRVCAFTFDATGPRFFTVERKDGSIAWFGDRRDTTGATVGDYPNGALLANGTGQTAVLSWAITRFQDSTGNYIDYDYVVNPAGANYPGEQHIARIQWTGKTVLPGQAGTARTPTQSITFNYSKLPTTEMSRGYASGTQLWQTQQLDSVTVFVESTVVRYYALTHQQSIATHALVLSQLHECLDATEAICLPATTFALTAGQNSFSTSESQSAIDFSNLVTYKIADIDGDGRPDIVWFRDKDPACPSGTSRLLVSFSDLDASGNQIFTTPLTGVYCSDVDMATSSTVWQVFDYNGDGRADLMIPIVGGTFAIYPSVGRPTGSAVAFNVGDNLAAGFSPGIPAVNDSASVPELADLNGDGQLDAIYMSTAGVLAARLSERRSDGSWGWGAERPLLLAAAVAGDPCDLTGPNKLGTCTYGGFANTSDHVQLYDFNGDGRADVVMGAVLSVPILGTGGCNQVSPHEPVTRGPRRMLATTSRPNPLTTPSCTNVDQYLEVMTVSQIATGETGAVTLTPGYSWDTCHNDCVNPAMVKFADFNGDGMTDVILGSALVGGGAQWDELLNDGTGNFVGTGDQVTVANNASLQLVDIAGNGRTDLVYPAASGGASCTFVAQMAQPDGTFAPESALPGGQAHACGNNDLDSAPWIASFNAFGGDGTLEEVTFRTDKPGIFVSRAPSGSRFEPQDLIQTITNGYGALTQMLYTPLTNSAVYRPDQGSLNNPLMEYGRGSAIIDLFGPMYVVGNVASSAPVFGNPAAMSEVYYRYAGAKMQAGGRGFLGFREISTVDPNQPGSYVATTTDYRQDFPFIGSPTSTTKTVVAGAYSPPTCLTGINSSNGSGNACFLPPGHPFTAYSGVNVSQSAQVWEATPVFASGVQQPLQVTTEGTEDKLSDLATGATTSDVWTSFLYDAFGDVTQSTVDTYSGNATGLVSSLVTANTYDNFAQQWRLGRLRTSAVTHTRGSSAVVRNTAFTYDTASAAMTGLLLSEEIQPGGAASQDRRTVYTLDAYGNRTSTTTCSADIATCSPNGLVFQPLGSAGPSASVQRYSRATYDSIGQYPYTTSEPFWNGSGSTEVVTQTVLARSALGDVLKAVNAQGVQTLAVPGSFGRPYYAWAQTVAGTTAGNPLGGAESWVTYRWCGAGTNQVGCPAGAVFRQRTIADGAPTKWTYYDVLGRPLIAVGQTFNANVTGQQFAGVCTYFDAENRTRQTSNPFFLNDAATGGEPSFTSDSCATHNWAVVTYDLLSRPLKTVFADSSSVSSVYNALTTTTTDQLQHATVTVKNALGEKVSVTDSAGLTTSYSYDGAGDLATVARNGGNGPILTSYFYDALGRKTSQVDGDTGTYRYTYNAAGDLLRQTDGKGQSITSEYDARGRVWRKIAYTLAGAVESTSQFVFDADPNAPGKQTLGAVVSESIVHAGTSTDNMTRGYSYDVLGRPSAKTHSIDGSTYTEAMLYDPFGRVQESQDATGHWLRTQYGPTGFVAAQCEGDGSDINTCGAAPYIRTLLTDNWGHATSETRGAVATTRSYSPLNGRLATTCSLAGQQPCGSPLYCINTTVSNSCPLQDETYTWDAKGNLLTRSRGASYTENFKYDANDRLLEGWYTVLGGTSYALAAPTLSTAANVTEC